jgi:hypothetical protein
MATVEERKAIRSRLLDRLYDQYQPGRLTLFDYDQWADDEGVDRSEALHAADWPRDRDLAASRAAGPYLDITGDGIDEVERRRSPPARSAVALAVVDVADLRRPEPALGEVRRLANERGDELEPDHRDELVAQLDTITAQRRSPRARKGVIGAALAAILWVLDASAEGVVAAGTLAVLQSVASALGY